MSRCASRLGSQSIPNSACLPSDDLLRDDVRAADLDVHVEPGLLVVALGLAPRSSRRTGPASTHLLLERHLVSCVPPTPRPRCLPPRARPARRPPPRAGTTYVLFTLSLLWSVAADRAPVLATLSLESAPRRGMPAQARRSTQRDRERRTRGPSRLATRIAAQAISYWADRRPGQDLRRRARRVDRRSSRRRRRRSSRGRTRPSRQRRRTAATSGSARGGRSASSPRRVRAHQLDRLRAHGCQPAERVDEHREEAEDGGDRDLRPRAEDPEPRVRDRREGDDRDRVGGDHVRHQRVAERAPAGEDERGHERAPRSRSRSRRSPP